MASDIGGVSPRVAWAAEHPTYTATDGLTRGLSEGAFAAVVATTLGMANAAPGTAFATRLRHSAPQGIGFGVGALAGHALQGAAYEAMRNAGVGEAGAEALSGAAATALGGVAMLAGRGSNLATGVGLGAMTPGLIKVAEGVFGAFGMEPGKATRRAQERYGDGE
jgi:hypothetical protein